MESCSASWNSYGYEVPFSSAGSGADDGFGDAPVWDGNGYNMSSCSYQQHQYSVNGSGVATWTRTVSATAKAVVTNYAGYAYAAVTLSSYSVSTATVSAAVRIDQDQQVLPPSATTERFSATVSNASGFTLDWIKISVDGQPRVTATIPTGSSQGYIDWNSSSALNPSEHTVSATAQIHDSIGAITLDSQRPEGNGRVADAVIADIKLKSLKFTGNIALTQDATTPVPTPEFTWSSGSLTSSNPAAYLMSSSVGFSMALGSSSGANLTGTATKGYLLKLQANPNTINPATSVADPTLTLYDNSGGTPTNCNNTTAITATTALDGWVARYTTSFPALSFYVKFTHVTPTPTWGQVCSYGSATPGNVLYAVLATPTAPMATPWTGVLDDACVWAARTASATAATTALATKLYNNGTYNGGVEQDTTQSTTPETFYLQDFIYYN